MRICLVSAMFFEHRKIKVEFRPEVVLADGLRKRGHEVITLHHWDPLNPSRFDVIHIHHLGVGALRSVFLRCETPLIYTHHDCRAMYGLLSLAKSWAYRAVLSRVETIVALSDTEARFLAERYAVERSRIVRIYNGINQDCFFYRRANHGGNGASIRVLYAGQLQPLKGVDVLLRALARISQPWTLDLVFHVADNRGSLEALVDELHVRDKVRFVGQLTAEALALRYQEADILALPSFTEALPSVVSEAMLCGTPILATDVGGVREQLGGFGIVVPPGSVEGMTAGLTKLIQEYEAVRAQGVAMSARARRMFDVEEMISAHEDLYARLQSSARRKTTLSRWPIGPIGNSAAAMAIEMRKRRASARSCAGENG